MESQLENINPNKGFYQPSVDVQKPMGERGNSSGGLQFDDHRPSAIQLRQLQEIAYNSPQVKHQKSLQLMADKSSVVKKQEAVFQLAALSKTNLNIVGENHGESGKRRDSEETIAKNHANGGYWREAEFRVGKAGFFSGIYDSRKRGDSPALLVMMNGAMLKERCTVWANYMPIDTPISSNDKNILQQAFPPLNRFAESIPIHQDRAGNDTLYSRERIAVVESAATLLPIMKRIAKGEIEPILADFHAALTKLTTAIGTKTSDELSKDRSHHMSKSAMDSLETKGVWKVGDDHITDMQNALRDMNFSSGAAIQSRNDFNTTYAGELKDDE